MVERAAAGEAPSSPAAASTGLRQTEEREISIGEAGDVSIGDLLENHWRGLPLPVNCPCL